MECEGLYLYGFAWAGVLEDITLAGLVEGQPVAALERRGVAALYSRVPVAEFEAALAAGVTPDPQWIIPRACRHEQVLEAMMERSTVLPVRFGAIFSSTDALVSFSEAHSEKIRRFLGEMEGKQEWAIKILVDLDHLADLLIEMEADLADQQASLPRSPGTRYFQEKQLRNQARTRAGRVSHALAVELKGRIQQTGWAVQSLPVRNPAGSGATLLLHLAVLLPGTEAERLESLIASLPAWHHEAALWIERTGPWPPSHFCPVLEAATPCELELTP